MEKERFKDYITVLDNKDKQIIDGRVAEKGIENYLSQQLIYLDCSRVYKDGTRAMQTIGYPYQREITSYLYALENQINFMTCDNLEEFDKQIWMDKLEERHKANLEYEVLNPPIWYGGKKAKKKWEDEHNDDKLPRRRKSKESTIPGFGKELATTERLKRLKAQFGELNFKIKL